MAAIWTHLALLVVAVGGARSLPVTSDSSVSGPFTGYRVLEIQPHSSTSVPVFMHELQSAFQADVWGRPSRHVIDVMIRPHQMDDVIHFLRDRSAQYKVKVADVQRLLDRQAVSRDHHRQRRSVLPLSDVTRHYLTFPQIQQFLRNVQENATEADVTLSSLGNTFEGRVTPYVTIRQRNSTQSNKSVVILEAGIHAREWIAPAMALNIVYKLAFNPDNDPDVDQLLQAFDWIIIPVTNPDGYVFSHQNASTRLWRKTRTTRYSNDPFCLGVDGNRNFGYQWSNSVYQGGNSNPCTDNYSGPRGFSEPETRNLRSLLLRVGPRTALYLSMHSYGQLFLYPWGYDSRATLEDEPDLREVGQRFSEAMLQRNRWYEVGASAKVLYTAAGASDDYARGGAGIKYTFTVELSPIGTSRYGFLLPPNHIPSVVSDHWPAFKAVALAIWTKLNQTNTTDNNNNNNNNNSSDDILSNDGADDEENENSELSQGLSNEDDLQDRVGRGGETPKTADEDGDDDDDDTYDDDMTELMIDGQIYHINFNNPAFTRWMENYIEFLDYRRRQQAGGGKRRRR
ncbi:carboxypeptidase B-like isoform X2 [Babylonia areolata]|uniref:carboxypeptidase B-like isoform X2 n=1 Tax=Babylonia areolata TaxID=304850 RepID=UPI003FD0BFAF